MNVSLPSGEMTEVKVPVDKSKKNGIGYAFVTFMFPEHAVKAYAELDRTSLRGRILHILPGQQARGEDDSKLSFKQKNEKERKQGEARGM